jgi:hypothetical protein
LSVVPLQADVLPDSWWTLKVRLAERIAGHIESIFPEWMMLNDYHVTIQRIVNRRAVFRQKDAILGRTQPECSENST